MYVINPNKITLVSSSVPENDAPVWVASTTYKKEDKVLYEHRVYISIADGNIGHAPASNTYGVDAFWIDAGSSNLWKMFDQTLATQTTVEGEGEQKITFTVKFNNATGFALLNLTGTQVVASVTEVGDSAPYWSKEYNLLNSVGDWWEWFFDDQSFVRDLVVTDIPATKDGLLTIVFTGAKTIGIGHFTHGKQKFIGRTLSGMTPSLRSYSKKEVNEFGDLNLVKRKSAKRYSGDLYVLANAADSTFNLLSDLENVLALWIGDDVDTANGGYQSLTVFGWIEEFHEPINDAFDVRISITIQGLA